MACSTNVVRISLKISSGNICFKSLPALLLHNGKKSHAATASFHEDSFVGLVIVPNTLDYLLVTGHRRPLAICFLP